LDFDSNFCQSFDYEGRIERRFNSIVPESAQIDLICRACRLQIKIDTIVCPHDEIMCRLNFLTNTIIPIISLATNMELK
jgi:hypothetical protein